MKAVKWMGKHDVKVDDAPDPQIIDSRDAIVKVTSTAICGSDLHLYNNFIPTMESGDILGHEFMGEIVELGSEVKNLAIGDRVVVPFTIAYGQCFFCKSDLWAACDVSNPKPETSEKLYGYRSGGLFGYSHMMGGFAGGQAEFARVPFADVGPFKVPDSLDDEKVLFLTDIYPTGYMAAENCNIEEGQSVAVWGCGPVGQFAIKSAFLLGAGKVFAIDHYENRLGMAAASGAEIINFDKEDVYEKLKDMTGGRGPDACIDAVGLEAHGVALDAIYDYIKTSIYLGTDRPHALRQAIHCCRKGGTVSIPGVYGGLLDKFNFGAAFGKGLTMKMGQTHVHKYLPQLLSFIEEGKIDPSFVISHRLSLDDAPEAYDKFNTEKEDWRKVVLKP